MATISRMAINLAWDGADAEAGLNKTAHLLKATGIAALDAAQNFSKAIQDRVKNLGLSISEIRSLTKLSELDKERALDRMEEESNLRSMSKNSQLLYEQMTQQAEEAAKAEANLRAQQEARAKMLAGLNALEKDQLFAKEKERALLLTMTGDQIKKYEADKAATAKAKADAESRAKMLAGLSALEKQQLMEKEARRARIMGMTAKQQLAFEAQEKAAEKARAKAEAWADMTWIQKMKKSLQGAQDIKATIEMVRGLFRLMAAGPMAAAGGVKGALSLSGELETTKISMGVLLGSFAKGADQIDRLRRVSVDLGVPLKDVADAFRTLFVGGVNAGDAEQLLKTFGKIAPLLGQGGIGQLAQGIAGMARSGMAEKSALDQLASSGLPVYEALAERLTVITGELHSVRMAQDAVERGAVLASTAIGSMQEAARSPQALEAAQKFAESLDGQILRLREALIDIFRDVGDIIRNELPIENLIASIRGSLDVIADIVRKMVSNLAGGGNSIEDSFKNGRTLALDFVDALLTGVAKIQEMFGGIDAIMKRLVARAEWWKRFYEAESILEVTQATEQYKGALFLADQADKNAKTAVANAKKFVEELRAKGVGAGGAAGGGAGGSNVHHLLPKDMPVNIATRALLDNFTEMRDLQSLALQGKGFDAGTVSSKVTSFLEKFGPKPDAGINQRIEAGSAAAAEAIMRSRTGVSEQSIGEAIKRAVEEAKDQQKAQTKIETDMLDAIRKLKMPAVAVIPK